MVGGNKKELNTHNIIKLTTYLLLIVKIYRLKKPVISSIPILGAESHVPAMELSEPKFL
jgi:hypothetical protein